MVITVLHWSAKHHVHQGRFTDTCRIDADLELKQTLTMICEAYIPLFAPPSTTCIPDQYTLTTSKLHLHHSLINIIAQLHIPDPRSLLEKLPAMPPRHHPVMISLAALFSFLAWAQACQGLLCTRDDQNSQLDKMNGLYPLPYGMSLSGASTKNSREGFQCGYYPQFNDQPAANLPRCYFEAAINNFCQKAASSFIVESLASGPGVTAQMNTNISAVYDFSLAGNPRIFVGVRANDNKLSPECTGKSTNTNSRFYQCTNMLAAPLNFCA